MIEFKFPDVGEGIHEGTIVKWRVKEGEEVKSDQVLVEVETDKAIVEIPSPRAGVIAKIFHKEQELIKVGETLVVIVDKGETYDPAAVSQPPVTQAPIDEKGPGVVGSIDSSNTEIPKVEIRARAHSSKSVPWGQVTTQNSTFAIKILPATRMLAQKLGVDVLKISGTGANGLITDEDIRAATLGAAPVPAPVSAPSPAKTFPGDVTRTPYKGIRKAIGDNMTKSHMHTAPVTHFDTIDVTKLVAKRESEKPAAQSQGIKLTFLAYITKAVVETLKEFPAMNTELDESSNRSSPEIITKNFYNIGIAVDTDDGLFVPTIKDADKKDLFTIAKEIVEIAEKARTKKLTPQDMSGGTFTITNYGSIGGDFATPVINYPEAAILGLGKIKDSISLDVEGKPVISKVMGFALTFDHRILDGATAARFVNAVAEKLQM